MNDRGVAQELAQLAGEKGGEDSTIFSILHAAHVLEGRVESSLEKVGLSLAKYGVLTELVKAPRCLTLSELAARLSCVRSNMTQLVDRLEADGVVRRADDPADRRAVRAEITPLGRERQSAGAAEIAKLHEEFSTSVSEGDRMAIGRLLSALE